MINMILELNAHKVFQNSGIKYLYIAQTGALFELDEKTDFLITMNGCSIERIQEEMLCKFSTSQSEIEAMLNDFRSVGLIDTAIKKEELQYSLNYLHGVELMVCQCCNLACSYCYASEGEYNHPGVMSENVGKKAIDFLFAHTQDDHVSISFFGGGPLINIELIKILVEYANQIALQNDKHISYAVTTNGTLISEDIANFFKANNFYVSFSVDGTQVKHDLHRISKSGVGSYDNSVKNIHLLGKNHISLRATSTPENDDYVEIAEALYNQRKTDFYIGEAMNCFQTEESLQAVECSYDRLIKHFYTDLQHGKIDKCKANSLIYQNLKKIAYFKERSCSCTAFITTLAVDVDGKMYPCHRFVGSSYVIGNVNLLEINIQNAARLFEKDFLLKNRIGCSECWAQNLCVGGCPYINHEATGHCNIPNEMKCRLNKYLFEKLLIFFISLSDEEKHTLRLS